MAYAGLWLSPANRNSRRALSFTAVAYSLAFEFYDAILGMTWQADLLEEHTKLGYDVIGCIPKMNDEPYVYIVHLTREAFYQSRLYSVARRV
jgi:hypothetical protein